MKQFVFSFLFVMFISNLSFAQSSKIDIKEIYKKNDLNGAIYIAQGMKVVNTYNEKKLEKPLHPGSCFALITVIESLQKEILTFNSEEEKTNYTKLVTDEYAQFYKNLVNEITYADWVEIVKEKQYGNANVSGGPKNFWQNGGLLLSAKEQLDFLQRLTMHQLNYSKENVETSIQLFSQKFGNFNTVIIKGISAEETNNTYTLLGFIPEKNLYFVSTIDNKGKLDYDLHNKHTNAVNEIISSVISTL